MDYPTQRDIVVYMEPNVSSRLDYFSEQMEAMNGGDPEADHSRADALLVEAIRLIPNLDSYSIAQLDRLVAAYEGVRKWYA